MWKKRKRPKISLHHCAISVSDLQRSIDFYERIFGFKVDTRTTTADGEMEIVHLRNGDDYLELFAHKKWVAMPEFAKDNQTDLPVIGTKHVAFSTADPEVVHSRLQEEGVDGLTEIFDNNPNYKYFFFRDPDGIPLEIVTRIHAVPPAY